ncbi:MAG: O-antigen ligase family protein [Propionibacteriaceae bacterium]|nr:O-antigen ligase family protein [Propionibacteriaceae bacterium]
MIRVAISTILLALATTSVPLLAPYSLATRMLAIAIIWLPPSRPQRNHAGNAERKKSLTGGGAGFALGNLILLIASTIPHGLTTTFLNRLPSVLVFVLFVDLAIRRYAPNDILRGVTTGLTLVVAGSLISIVVDPSVAIEQGRVRGLLENANTLGFVAGVLVVASVGVGIRGLSTIVPVALGFSALLLSGSRGGMLFLGIALLGFAFSRIRPARWILILGGVAALLLSLAAPRGLSNFDLFRGGNSRLGTWEVFLRVLEASPWLGLGIEDGIRLPVAGSWAGALVWGGLLGVVGITVSAVAVLLPRRESDRRARSLMAAALAYSLVESWMLSLSGTTTLIIFLVWIGLSERQASGSTDAFPGSPRRAGFSSPNMSGDNRAVVELPGRPLEHPSRGQGQIGR